MNIATVFVVCSILSVPSGLQKPDAIHDPLKEESSAKLFLFETDKSGPAPYYTGDVEEAAKLKLRQSGVKVVELTDLKSAGMQIYVDVRFLDALPPSGSRSGYVAYADIFVTGRALTLHNHVPVESVLWLDHDVISGPESDRDSGVAKEVDKLITVFCNTYLAAKGK